MSKYYERVQLGLCGSCGNPSDGNSRCEKCREKNRVRLKERYNKRKLLGLCLQRVGSRVDSQSKTLWQICTL